MNFSTTNEETTKKGDSGMSEELLKKLETENEILVVSLKSVYYQNMLAKREHADLKERENNARTSLSKAIKNCEYYKKRSEEISESLEKSHNECDQLKKTKGVLSARIRKALIAVILLCLALAISMAFSIWSQSKSATYKAFSREVKAAVADSPLATDIVSDSIRYDYERIFGTTW